MHAHLHTLTRPHTQLLQAGCSAIVSRIVEDLKDEAEPYRRMVMETIDKVVAALGAADIDARLEELLVDGILYAFQEQVREGMRDFTLRGVMLPHPSSTQRWGAAAMMQQQYCCASCTARSRAGPACAASSHSVLPPEYPAA
jgi:hypothetical protein